MRTLKDLPLNGKRIFVRVDLNVPIENGVITDDTRIRGALETIKYLLKQDCALILASHLGQPKGVDVAFSLAPIAKRLSELLRKDVIMAPACRGMRSIVDTLVKGQILLLENVRFDPGETKNDAALAKEWASYADFYVNDAFGTCHRAHASVAAITNFLPSAAGFLVEKEVKALRPLLDSPKRPFVVVMGGSKLSTKLKMIERLLPKVDSLLLGGAMVFTLLKAKGVSVGTSLVEELEAAKALASHPKIVLPSDVVVAKSISETKGTKTVSVSAIPEDMMGVDIGAQTLAQYGKILIGAKAVLWNGPMGVFEVQEFSHGTQGIAQILSRLDATTIVGGGDSVAAVNQYGLADRMSHVSTGGGATLEFVENGTLPALDCLEQNLRQYK